MDVKRLRSQLNHPKMTSMLREMWTDIGGSNDRRRRSEGRQFSLSVYSGLTLTGDFAQRGAGWDNAEKKPQMLRIQKPISL